MHPLLPPAPADRIARRIADVIPFALAFLLVAVCGSARLRAADPPPPQRTIHTTGEAVVYVTPDEVQVGLGVETFNKNLDEAKSSNDAASQKLVKAIREAGVEEKHIQTDTLQLEIRYHDQGRPIVGVEGYMARRMYSVTVKDPKNVQRVVDAALKNGANYLMGIEYRTTEMRKYRDQARKMAVKAAKEKAEMLAGELACKLGRPMTINEANYGYYGYYGYAWGGRWGGYGANAYANAQNSVQVMGGGGNGGDDSLPLGQVGVHATVQVVFELVE